MNIIKCPHCGKDIELDETTYNSISFQVRDAEFKRELEGRLKEMGAQNEQATKLALLEQATKSGEEIAKQKQMIEKLQEQLSRKDLEKTIELKEALSQKDQELVDKNNTIFTLKNAIENSENSHKLAIKNLESTYDARLKEKQEQIDYYKDLKARLSTKMVGETLEQHCEIEFNKLRATAFPNAYFEKDNDASHGSKGDFIFRDKTEDGVELVSIMFEMKNETDTTGTKHKNEDFFKELDKDRNEKKCEYAVLVSLLEPENELYNTGIVDVSYRYNKMYVIRPQFFIPLITLIRNAALNSAEYKRELLVARNQNLDIAKFEADMNEFKDKFSKNARLVHEKFANAVAEIDKTIDHLQKTKENLLSSINNLRLANNKVEDLSLKKLAKNNPTLQSMIDGREN